MRTKFISLCLAFLSISSSAMALPLPTIVCTVLASPPAGGPASVLVASPQFPIKNSKDGSYYEKIFRLSADFQTATEVDKPANDGLMYVEIFRYDKQSGDGNTVLIKAENYDLTVESSASGVVGAGNGDWVNFTLTQGNKFFEVDCHKK